MDCVDGGESMVSDVLWGVFVVGGCIFHNLLGGVSDDVLYSAECVPVEEGGVEYELVGEVFERRLEVRVGADPVGDSFWEENSGWVGVTDVRSDGDVVGGLVGVEEVTGDVGVYVVEVVFVGLDVGEDAVQEGSGGVGVGVGLRITSVSGLFVLGEGVEMSMPMSRDA